MQSLIVIIDDVYSSGAAFDYEFEIYLVSYILLILSFYL